MNIIFIGAVKFSLYCLEHTLLCKGNVVGVITPRSFTASDSADIGIIARSRGIPVHSCDNVNSQKTIAFIRSLKPDIIFCFGWSRLLEEPLLSIPTLGVVGSHPSLLPANRGRHPIIWALALGLTETGLTFFMIDQGVDSGHILSQRKITISKEDDAASLYAKIEASASEQISEFLPCLKKRQFTVIPQDYSKANYWRKRSEADGKIDWRMNPDAVVNLVRALATPYPGAHFFFNEQRFLVWRAKIYNGRIPANLEPGRVLSFKDGVAVVRTNGGAVKLEYIDPPISCLEGDILS